MMPTDNELMMQLLFGPGNKIDKWLNLVIPGMLTNVDECILWPFAKTDGGYPIMKVDGRITLVTRNLLEIYDGPPPTPDHHAAHCPVRCTSQTCINVTHLRWATPAENMADKKRRVR